MTSSESVVTRKGQITIPVKLRRKFGIEEGSKVEVVEEEGKIAIKKRPSIFDLAGSGAGKANVEDLKKMLDQMRDQDA
jgi:AbrB family looped-hinge helix DNA binding protein